MGKKTSEIVMAPGDREARAKKGHSSQRPSCEGGRAAGASVQSSPKA